jgi:hypothetical protein
MLLVNLTGLAIVYKLSTQFAYLLFGRLRWKEFTVDIMPRVAFFTNKPQSPSSKDIHRTVAFVAIQMSIYSHVILQMLYRSTTYLWLSTRHFGT